MTLNELQLQSSVWTKSNFGKHPSYQPLLGVVEEVGELAHAHLKNEQGIRGTPDEHRAAKIDAIGDIIIYLVDYCNQEDISIQKAVEDTWAQVKARDWTKDKLKGGE